MTAHTLLRSDDPEPVGFDRLESDSPFFVTADHAGRAIPASLDMLGLGQVDMDRHIAWDIGALKVAEQVAAALAAPLIYQRYSRLVIDSNRQITAPNSIPVISEYTQVAGNEGLTDDERKARQDEIFWPYHAAITQALDARLDKPPILVAIHSCTPCYKGQVRTMEIGSLYGPDRRFAGLVLDALRQQVGDGAVDNQPYQVDMTNDYSIPVHAEARGLLYVEIEIRQDLISTDDGVETWAAVLTRALEAARRTLEEQ